MRKRLLIVEDDASLAWLLRDNLVFEGFDVECVTDGVSALERAHAARPDLVLLDVMIPCLDGFEVCRILSGERDRIPIIMLTARAREQDRIHGLAIGADDYVTKPFSLDELVARIHAVLRRSQRTVDRITCGGTIVDFMRMRAFRDGVPMTLTAREFALLRHLAEHAGRVVSRDELLRTVWGYQQTPLTRTVDNFVARLRRKIEPDPRQPRFIRTVHGDGYSLVTTQQ